MKFLKDKSLAIWDFDGTIADSEPLHMLAYQRVFDEVIPDHPAIDSDYYFYNIASKGGGVERLALDFPIPFDVSELKQRKRVIYDSFTKDGSIKIFPEIAEVLKLQRERGMKVMIASNSAVETNQQVLVDNAFNKDSIDFYVGPSEDMPRKPEPDMFLHCLELAGFSADDSQEAIKQYHQDQSPVQGFGHALHSWLSA